MKKKNTLVFTLILTMLATSCAVTNKFCPSQDPHHFYRAYGLKTPKAVLLNQRGYSRPKLKTKF